MKSFPSICCLLLLLSTTLFASPFPGDATPTLPTDLSAEQLQHEPTQQPSSRKRKRVRLPLGKGESSLERKRRLNRDCKRRASAKLKSMEQSQLEPAQPKVPRISLPHLSRQKGESRDEYKKRFDREYHRIRRVLDKTENLRSEPVKSKVPQSLLSHLSRQEDESPDEYLKRYSREYKRIRRVLDKMEKLQSEPVKSKVPKISLRHLSRKEGESKSEYRKRYNREYGRCRGLSNMEQSQLEPVKFKEGESKSEYRKRYNREYGRCRGLSKMEQSQLEPVKSKGSSACNELGTSNQLNPFPSLTYPSTEHFQQSSSSMVAHHGDEPEQVIGNNIRKPKKVNLDNDTQKQAKLNAEKRKKVNLDNATQKRTKVNADNTQECRKVNLENATRIQTQVNADTTRKRNEINFHNATQKRTKVNSGNIGTSFVPPASVDRTQIGLPSSALPVDSINGAIETHNNGEVLPVPSTYKGNPPIHYKALLQSTGNTRIQTQVNVDTTRKRKEINFHDATQKRTKVNSGSQFGNIGTSFVPPASVDCTQIGLPSSALPVSSINGAIETHNNGEVLPVPATYKWNPPIHYDVLLQNMGNMVSGILKCSGVPSLFMGILPVELAKSIPQSKIINGKDCIVDRTFLSWTEVLPVDPINGDIESHNNGEVLPVPATYTGDPPVHYEVHLQNTGHSMTSFLKCNGLPSTFTGILPMELAKSIPQSKIINGKNRIVDRTFMNWRD